jgi:hypothetical protein
VNSAIAAGGNGVQMLIELIEQKVLIEIDQRISGFASAQLTVAEGVKLADMLADAQKVIGRNRS